MSKEIVEKVKEFVKRECEKPQAFFKGAYIRHIIPVVRYAFQLAEKENADKENADKEIVEIAAWLHDIASIRGDYENYHISSAKIAEQLLKSLNYPQEKIEQVKHCILSHRGSKEIKKETKEAQILADADAMSHFDDIGGILKNELFNNDKRQVLEKLERSYLKLSDYAKPLVRDKLEKARKELR